MAQNQACFDIALKKGNIGESIVRNILESKGWIVYFPFTKDKPHYFDMLATFKKDKAIAVDVKTKARLNCFPGTGIDKRHYDEYMRFVEATKIPFFLVFVDEITGEIHTAELAKLTQPRMLKNGEIIAWQLDQMKKIGNLDLDQMKELQCLSQRNHSFKPSESNL